MSKITSYSADYQTFPALFELEPVAGKKVTADFSAPELSSPGGGIAGAPAQGHR